MIIFDASQKQSLLEFGIEIPVHDSRAINTFKHLRHHPRLGSKIKAWHIDTITEAISRDDLLRVHSRPFVDNLFSDELENEIIRTYELIDESGRYHRYNPAGAVLPLTDLFDMKKMNCHRPMSLCCLWHKWKNGIYAFIGF
jgi:hypothetical protein